ncbi:MAG: hypothetical protein PWR13_1345 [Archaeoglobi archaeon]|nr:hypothetical protein [Archaeoglobi archaeon]
MKPIPVGIEEGNNTPKQTPQLVKRPASYEFKLNLRLNREVNTLNPIGEEYLLEPKFNLGEMECPEDDPHYRNTRCFNYTTFIYYESEPFVNASLSIWLNGRNSWFQMGWTGNEFNDRIYVENLREGWNEVRGLLKTGIGVYR